MTNQDTLTLLFNNIHLIVFAKYTPQQQAEFIDKIADILNEIINNNHNEIHQKDNPIHPQKPNNN